jgi:hypothetical protein
MVDFPGLAAVFERIVLRRADFGAVELGYQSHRRLDPRHATDILLAIDSNEDFIQVPNIPQAALTPLQSSRLVWTELLTPQSNRFIRDDDSAFRENILNISEAQAETMVNPDGIADDF